MASDSAYDDIEDRAELVSFYLELSFFVDAIYFYNKLSQKKKDVSVDGNQGRRLTDESKENPTPLIEEFCEAFTMKDVRNIMWFWFETVCNYQGELKENIYALATHDFYLNLLTLVGSAQVIFRTGNTQ
jgi:hypothetical protein